MSEPSTTEDNEFYDTIVGDALAMEAEDGARLDQAMERLFSEAIDRLEITGEDEEADQQVMSGAIRELMRRCFIGGLAYQYLYGGPSREDRGDEIVVPISAEDATAIVTAMIVGGVLPLNLRLAVERGQD